MDCPDGFCINKQRDNKGRCIIYYQCKKIQFNSSTNQNVQCSYKIRKDNYKEDQHDHIFINKINNYFNSEIKKIDQLHNIEEKLFNLVGNSNLSIKTATSTEMFSLIESAFELGKLKNNSNFEDLFTKTCRTTFTKRFIEYSNNIKNNRIFTFRGCSALCIDSGTIGSTSILNIVLINANKKEDKPILFKSIWNFKGNFES